MTFSGGLPTFAEKISEERRVWPICNRKCHLERSREPDGFHYINYHRRWRFKSSAALQSRVAVAFARRSADLDAAVPDRAGDFFGFADRLPLNSMRFVG